MCISYLKRTINDNDNKITKFTNIIKPIIVELVNDWKKKEYYY
jgi:hypothetical protein